MPGLKALWKEFVKSPRRNPPLQGDELTQFLGSLSREGKLAVYSDKEWDDILEAYDLTPEETAQFMEQVASYLPSDGDVENEEPADFARED